MEKLERGFLENGGEWREFDFDKLFNVARGDIQNQKALKRNDVGVSFVAQNDINNGYVYKVSNNNYRKFKGNSIIIGRQTGVIYYQPEEFITTDGVLILEEKIPLIKNKRIGLFICSLMKKHMVIYGYTNTVSAKKLNNLKLDLPFLNGKINFSYMEKFIEELEAERIEELEAYLMVTGLKDYKLTKEDQKILDYFEKMSDNSLDRQTERQTDRIRLEDLLIWQTGISEIDPLKLNELYDKTSEKYPFYGQATDNNGIISYESLKAEVLNNKNALPTILVHSNNQNVVYLQTPFYLKDGHGATSVLQNENMDLDVALYIMSCIRKSITERFDYNAKATKIGLKNTEVEIPFFNTVVDYKFMKKFIKVVKKLVIKDVVIWADKKIEATKQVVERK
ncbi:restriction endonuclease subunit S [Lagierella sp. ICN-221743]